MPSVAEFNILKPAPELTAPTLKRGCIIFDLDGVLVDVGTPCEVDWDDEAACLELMAKHKPNWPVISMANFFSNHANPAQLAIFVMTGRPERYRAATIVELSEHKIHFSELFMRPDNDARHDHEIKREHLDWIRRSMDVWFVVEDRDSVVKMWRDAGVLCLQNQNGAY